MSRDFDRAQEMVVASMEYVKVLGFRIRRTEAQRDDWKQVAQSHADELIKLRQHVDALKAERDAAKQEAVSARQDAVTRAEADRKRIDGLMIQVQDMRAEIERLKKPARQHPSKVGEYVRRIDGDFAGQIAQVLDVQCGQYEVRFNQHKACWSFFNCTPCDPPQEASHITPEGKQTAEGALPQPGDVVRLVRVPTNDEYPHDSGRWEPNWGGIGDYMRVHYVGSNINGTRVVRAVFGLEWPVSCVEVVKGGDK